MDGLKAIAEVRVVSLSDAAQVAESSAGYLSGGNMIRWQGEVPAQKWMNFYTKVLGRFATTPGLKLRVIFEAPAEGDQGKAKADEARSGLKELGLDENVELS